MTNMSDEQGKGLTIWGTNWFGDKLRQVTKVGVSLRQYNDIAVSDIFNKNKSGKLSQDTPALPQVVKLGHAPDKIQVWKTTKGTNSTIKQARVMIPVQCTSPLWYLSTHEIS